MPSQAQLLQLLQQVLTAAVLTGPRIIIIITSIMAPVLAPVLAPIVVTLAPLLLVRPKPHLYPGEAIS